jgi:hypothetical protein
MMAAVAIIMAMVMLLFVMLGWVKSRLMRWKRTA